MKKTAKYFILFFLLFIICWVAGSFFGASILTRPQNVNIPAIDSLGDYKVEQFSVKTKDDVEIQAWLVPNDKDKIVILLAGWGGNRTGQLEKALFYLEKGYSVLLPDLRGTGMSKYNKVTYGWQERNDLLACIQKLKETGYTHISAHGFSLGSSAITYAYPDYNDFDFVVLESCYDNVDHAMEHRVEKYHIPSFLLKPLIFFCEKRIGTKMEDLNPQEYIAEMKCPVLIMSGDSEENIRVEETQALYDSCPSKTKAIHLFKGGKHEDFLARFKEEYIQTLTDFINLSDNH